MKKNVAVRLDPKDVSRVRRLAKRTRYSMGVLVGWCVLDSLAKLEQSLPSISLAPEDPNQKKPLLPPHTDAPGQLIISHPHEEGLPQSAG